MNAITVTEFGGPDVFTPTEQPRPSPGPEQVLVDVAVAGVNYMDVYQRTGTTPVKPPHVAAWKASESSPKSGTASPPTTSPRMRIR